MRQLFKALLVVVATSLNCHGSVVPGDDFNANTGSAVTTLQQWYNGSGLWDTTGWWNAANCIDAIGARIIGVNGGALTNVLANTFSLNSSGDFLDDYYDDEGWWAEAWIRAFDLTGNTNYLNMAGTIFTDMTNAWGSPCGGGIWWDKNQTYKNAIANELFLLDAISLHQRTPGDTGAPGSYLYWATNEWSWFKASGMINAQDLINDGLNDCTNNGETTWSYNQGVILGGLVDLYKSTGQISYLQQAEQIATAAITFLVNGQGILEDACEPSGCGGDGPQFKGIFARHLAELYDVDRNPAYFNFLYTNAHSIWSRDRNSSNQLGLVWSGPFDSADAARQSSAMAAISALAEPVTMLLPFSKAAGSPAFNHNVGAATGVLAWMCNSSNAPAADLMLYGPYLASLPPAKHTAHFRMAASATSLSSSNLASLEIRENNSPIASLAVPWSAFGTPNQFRDFQVPFTNTITGGLLDFRATWNNLPGSPSLTLGDISVDGWRNWAAATLSHDIGRLDGFNNWCADPVRDTSSGYLARGPGTSELGSGYYAAQFELAVDNFILDNANVATISVVDVDHGMVVATQDLSRGQFANTLFATFTLNFSAVGGVHYDFRTYWHFGANAPRLTQRGVVVRPTTYAATSSLFQPIALAASSYNQDMVVEKTAPNPPVGATTATMDTGVGDTGNTWYEQGYDAAAPLTGLPPAGATITNSATPDHLYTFAASYQSNNAACIDSTHSNNLVPLTKIPFAALSFLSAAGHGPVVLNCRVDHGDGTSENGSLSSPDWFFNTPVAFDAQGRVDVGSGTFNNVSNNNPRLYSQDITLANFNSPVTNVALWWQSGAGEAAVFGLSGRFQSTPLAASWDGQNLVLSWNPGSIACTTNLTSPWRTNGSATSPFELTPATGNQFFRVVAP
jgi:hypothetical protein